MNKPLTKKEWEKSVAETWSTAIEATYKDMIEKAVLEEREACAKVCENAPEPDGRDLAKRIRARGEQA